MSLDVGREAGGVEVAVVLGVALGHGRVLVVDHELEFQGERVGEDEHSLLGPQLFRDQLEELPATV